MSTSYTHLILTRFNVRIGWLGGRKASEEWMKHRLVLFERFTLPSMAGQTNRNFTWLVYVDADTPPLFMKRIVDHAKTHKFCPLFIRGNFDLGTVQWSIAPFIVGREFLITTRLDNDDALCRRFVEVIQKQFSRQNFEFINFTNGYVLQGSSLYAAQHRSNAFITLIEKTPHVRTVFCGDHCDLSRWGQIRQITELPGWLVTVHGENICNHVWGRHCDPRQVGRDFSLHTSPKT